jgi:hypothetical protein
MLEQRGSAYLGDGSRHTDDDPTSGLADQPSQAITAERQSKETPNMMDEIPPTPSSAQPLDHPLDHPLQGDSRGTPRESSPRSEDASENSSGSVTNERWENDLETDQMEQLEGREALADGEISMDEIADSSAEDF